MLFSVLARPNPRVCYPGGLDKLIVAFPGWRALRHQTASSQGPEPGSSLPTSPAPPSIHCSCHQGGARLSWGGHLPHPPLFLLAGPSGSPGHSFFHLLLINCDMVLKPIESLLYLLNLVFFTLTVILPYDMLSPPLLSQTLILNCLFLLFFAQAWFAPLKAAG